MVDENVTAPTPAPAAPPTWALDTVVRSLSGTDAMYLCAQVRAIGPTMLRFQSTRMGEHTFHAGPDVIGWVEAMPAPHASLAGTAAKYAECFVRPNVEPAGLRVQLAGVAGNRAWGAEWLHGGVELPKVGAAILAATAPPTIVDGESMPIAGGIAPIGAMSAESPDLTPDYDDTDDDADDKED